MYDALFVHLARELELPILASDTQLSRAAGQTVQMEVLRESDQADRSCSGSARAATVMRCTGRSARSAAIQPRTSASALTTASVISEYYSRWDGGVTLALRALLLKVGGAFRLADHALAPVQRGYLNGASRVAGSPGGSPARPGAAMTCRPTAAAVSSLWSKPLCSSIRPPDN